VKRHDDPTRDDMPPWIVIVAFVMLAVGLLAGRF
jgi:hypothetical protein